MITVEQHETIRRMYYLEEQSGRQIAKTLGISRQSVAKALQSDLAPTYTLTTPREAPQLGPHKARIDELLNENKRMPRKQRYTAHKIFQLLQREGDAGSESSVQGYAVHWRKGHRRPATFLPLEFERGADAQVDWGEAQAVIADVAQTVQYFVMRLNYSRRSFVMTFPAQKQEAFFEGHVRAFEHFGGVPHRDAATTIWGPPSRSWRMGASVRNSEPSSPFAVTTCLRATSARLPKATRREE
jgi:transposase